MIEGSGLGPTLYIIMESDLHPKSFSIIILSCCLRFLFRFRCLLTTMHQSPSNVETIVMAACVLHNLIRLRNPAEANLEGDSVDPATNDIIPGSWRDENHRRALTGLESSTGNTSVKAAKLQRDYLCAYYNSARGSVPWQDCMI